MEYIIVILLALINIKQFKYIKSLQLPTAKTFMDLVTIIFVSVILIFLMYRYATAVIHYIAGTLGIILFITMILKEGITNDGFSSTYRYKEFISWDQIKDVKIKRNKYINITLYGDFIEQSFSFKNKHYDKLMEIIKNNLYKHNE